MKRKWLVKHGYTPKDAYFDSRKEKYAVNENGRANILIDDREEKLTSWTKNHGIGILYQANEHSVDDLKRLIKRLYSSINPNLITGSIFSGSKSGIVIGGGGEISVDISSGIDF